VVPGLQTNPPERNRWEKVMGLLQSQPNLTRFLASSYLHCIFLSPSLTTHTCISCLYIYIYTHNFQAWKNARLANHIHGGGFLVLSTSNPLTSFTIITPTLFHFLPPSITLYLSLSLSLSLTETLLIIS
jgi:hypothetical protein